MLDPFVDWYLGPIDTQSIRLLDDELKARLREIRLLQPYFEAKERELRQWYRDQGYPSPEEAGINGRMLTNVGTYRAYAVAYLRQHPKVQQDLTLLVRHRDPGPNGLPIELYCFTNDIRWAAYEDIQADIFDHLIAMTRVFDLNIHQSPASSDRHPRPRRPGALSPSSALIHKTVEIDAVLALVDFALLRIILIRCRCG